MAAIFSRPECVKPTNLVNLPPGLHHLIDGVPEDSEGDLIVVQGDGQQHRLIEIPGIRLLDQQLHNLWQQVRQS